MLIENECIIKPLGPFASFKAASDSWDKRVARSTVTITICFSEYVTNAANAIAKQGGFTVRHSTV